MHHPASESSTSRKRLARFATSCVLGATLIFSAGLARGQAEQSEDDSDSRTHLYSGLVESSALRRGKLRLSRTSWAFTAVGAAAAVYESNVFRGPDAQPA